MKVVSLENLSKYNELLNQKTVRSVNSVKPDSNGNVTLGTEKSTFNKVKYDTGYFSIAASNTYTFDLTGSDLENVSKDNVSIRLVAKVTTAHNGFEVGDIAQLTASTDFNAQLGNVDMCAYIHDNTLYLFSSNSDYLSIRTATGALEKAKVQIKAVLTAFIPDDGSILLIAEDQTNTSKLIGLPDGTLTWKDKNLVRSVNGVNADASGNVKLDISNGATVVETYVNGSDWYRIWSDGWLEQGGTSGNATAISVTSNGKDNTVTFLKPFKNINYSLVAINGGTNSNRIEITDDVISIKNKTTTTSVINLNGVTGDFINQFTWYACGQGA